VGLGRVISSHLDRMIVGLCRGKRGKIERLIFEGVYVGLNQVLVKRDEFGRVRSATRPSNIHSD
jgi:hypothetical protein